MEVSYRDIEGFVPGHKGAANLKRQAEIQFAVLQLETERLVETDGGEISFPDVQVDGHQRILFRPETHCVLVTLPNHLFCNASLLQAVSRTLPRTHPVGSVVMQFATRKVNNMQHHSACQSLFAESGLYHYSFDVP